jgi:hypothetical protein
MKVPVRSPIEGTTHPFFPGSVVMLSSASSDFSEYSVAARRQAGVEQHRKLVAGDGVGPHEGHGSASRGEGLAEAGQEGGGAAVHGVGEGAGELVGGDAVAAYVGDALALQGREEGVAVLAVGADDRDDALLDRAPGALRRGHAVVAVVAGQDGELAAVDAALGVDPAGVGLREGGHAGFVGGVGALRCPGHHLDRIVPGAPRATGDDPATGRQ